MADTTWLQCTMPRPEWEKLNKRRETLGVKWAQLIPRAVEVALDWLEKHPADLADLVGQPKAPKPAAKPKAKTKAPPKAKKTGPVEDTGGSPLSLAPTAAEVADLAGIK